MKLCIYILLGFIATMLQAQDYVIYDTKSGKAISVEDMAKRTKDFDVIFFGEFHDDSLIHVIQYEFLKNVYKMDKNVDISLEMFERDVQKQLDSFRIGAIDEEAFLKNSRPWSDYKKFYKPLVDLAKENEASVIAANIPRKYAAMYVQGGMTKINDLPDEEKAFVAREMLLKEDDYASKFFKTMLNSESKFDSLTPNQENTMFLYYGAQLIKDETMAESIVMHRNENPKRKIIHFNGDFHSNSYLGTVQKVAERNSKLKLGVITVKYFGDEDSAPKFDESMKKEGDFVIYSKEPKREPFPMMGGGSHFGENSVEKYDIEVVIIPESSSLEGKAKLKFKNPVLKRSSVKLLKSLKILSVEHHTGKLNYTINNDDPNYSEIIFDNPTIKNQKYGGKGIKEANDVTITYKGTVYNPPDETNLIQRHSRTAGIISAKPNEGIYLPGGSFYPQTDKDIAKFDVKITIPADYTIVTSGEIEIAKSGSNSVYSITTEKPIDGMILVGGKYIKDSIIYKDVEFSVYKLADIVKSEDYLTAMKEYYDFYTDLFGPYPYKSFHVVENFFASGFGMPGYTLLSGRLMAMPWVTLSPGSLAHEFVHNWWGNSVFVDYESGNWCEALTTFSTNYYYNELTGNTAGAEDWRKKALIAIASLPEDRNYPVYDFKYQKDTYDAVVGYSKGAFALYEVYKLFGKEMFFDVLKKFAERNSGKRAYWFNLTGLFNSEAKTAKLDIPTRKVFDQWLKEKEIPELRLKNVMIDANLVSLEIVQDLDYYISVPVLFEGDNQSRKEYFNVKDSVELISFDAGFEVKKIHMDPNYEVLRKLYKWEMPYSLNRTVNDNPIVVIPSSDSPDYNMAIKFMDMLKESGYNFKHYTQDAVTAEMVKDNSLILLGNIENNSTIATTANNLPLGMKITKENFQSGERTLPINDHILMMNIDHPINDSKLCTVIYFDKLQSFRPFSRLFHYMSFSLVMLNNQMGGKPALQQEIFPGGLNRDETVYIKVSKN